MEQGERKEEESMRAVFKIEEQERDARGKEGRENPKDKKWHMHDKGEGDEGEGKENVSAEGREIKDMHGEEESKERKKEWGGGID